MRGVLSVTSTWADQCDTEAMRYQCPFEPEAKSQTQQGLYLLVLDQQDTSLSWVG